MLDVNVVFVDLCWFVCKVKKFDVWINFLEVIEFEIIVVFVFIYLNVEIEKNVLFIVKEEGVD